MGAGTRIVSGVAVAATLGSEVQAASPGPSAEPAPAVAPADAAFGQGSRAQLDAFLADRGMVLAANQVRPGSGATARSATTAAVADQSTQTENSPEAGSVAEDNQLLCYFLNNLPASAKVQEVLKQLPESMSAIEFRSAGQALREGYDKVAPGREEAARAGLVKTLRALPAGVYASGLEKSDLDDSFFARLDELRKGTSAVTTTPAASTPTAAAAAPSTTAASSIEITPQMMRGESMLLAASLAPLAKKENADLATRYITDMKDFRRILGDAKDQKISAADHQKLCDIAVQIEQDPAAMRRLGIATGPDEADFRTIARAERARAMALTNDARAQTIDHRERRQDSREQDAQLRRDIRYSQHRFDGWKEGLQVLDKSLTLAKKGWNLGRFIVNGR